MLFNSQIFLFVFLPLTLIGYFGLNRIKKYNLASLLLVGMSLWFYGYNNPWYLILIVSSILFNYLISLLMEKLSRQKKVLCIIGVIFNLSLLGYYKYFNFFVENINAAFKTDIVVKNILLPLGISFFTLQQISYIIDRYRGDAPMYKPVDYAAYVSFFPQLIAGPIVLHSEFMKDFKDEEKRSFNVKNFTDGIIMFVLGLGKKVIVADTLAYYVNYGYDKVYWIDTPSAWLVAIFYSLELYFDFSGYSDMAIGLGKMFNIDIPVNFDSPYKAVSVVDFWRRWHMTLTRFFKNYLYIPMGGSRKGETRTVINIIIVFLVSGIWHGAGWTFIIWGAFQALGNVLSRFIHKKRKPGIVSRIFTIIFIITSWAIFRSDSTDICFRMLKAMFVPNFGRFILDISSATTLLPECYVIDKLLSLKCPQYVLIFYVLVTLLVLIVSLALTCGKNASEILAKIRDKGYRSRAYIGLALIFVYSIISLTQVSTFLYFNF